MKAVILDGYRLNPGDLEWKGFMDVCECTFYDRTSPEETIERAQGAELLITNKTVLSRAIIEQLPDLKYIGILATGYNVIDIQAARERGIVVSNVPAYSTESVAQTVFAHLLNITLRVDYHSNEIRKGRWQTSPDFSFWDTPLIALNGLSLGIVGLGNIGMEVARIAAAFRMNVIAYTSKKQEDLPAGIRSVDLETLFRESDVLSLHCPQTPETEKLVNAQRLSLMKPSAILINTSRGGLIDEEALAEALNNNRIYAAGVDVLSAEPPRNGNPLIGAKNCFLSPHYAWATRSTRKRLKQIAIENMRAFIEGRPQNVI